MRAIRPTAKTVLTPSATETIRLLDEPTAQTDGAAFGGRLSVFEQVRPPARSEVAERELAGDVGCFPEV